MALAEFDLEPYFEICREPPDVGLDFPGEERVGAARSLLTSVAVEGLDPLVEAAAARPSGITVGEVVRCGCGSLTAWHLADRTPWCELCWWRTDAGQLAEERIAAAHRAARVGMRVIGGRA